MTLPKNMKFSIKDFFHKFLLSHLQQKSLMKNFIFCTAWNSWGFLTQDIWQIRKYLQKQPFEGVL